MPIIKKKIIIYFSTFLIIAIVGAINHRVQPQSQTVMLETKYSILIFIEEKRLYLLENDKCIKEYPIASGKKDWPSPIGQWKIVDKGDWGEEFGGYWLGLNVTWGKYGIHGTLHEESIGKAASHGCIRMLNEDIKELYNIVPTGTTVIINGGPYGAFGTGFRSIYPGDRGADVLEIQKKLKILGYFSGKESGIYGEDLKKALFEFQMDHHLTVKNKITDEDYHAMGFFEFE